MTPQEYAVWSKKSCSEGGACFGAMEPPRPSPEELKEWDDLCARTGLCMRSLADRFHETPKPAPSPRIEPTPSLRISGDEPGGYIDKSCGANGCGSPRPPLLEFDDISHNKTVCGAYGCGSPRQTDKNISPINGTSWRTTGNSFGWTDENGKPSHVYTPINPNQKPMWYTGNTKIDYSAISRNPPNNQSMNGSVGDSFINRGFTTDLATKEDLLPRRTFGSQNITPIRQGNFGGKKKSSKKEFNAATDLFVDLMVDNKKSKKQPKKTKRFMGI